MARAQRRPGGVRERRGAGRPPPPRHGVRGQDHRPRQLRRAPPRLRPRRNRRPHDRGRGPHQRRLHRPRPRRDQAARARRHALPAHRVLARGDDALSRVPAALAAARRRRRRRRGGADRAQHRGRRPARGALDPELGAAARSRGPLRRADVRLGALAVGVRRGAQLAARRGPARVPRPAVERHRLRRDARGRACARIVQGRSRARAEGASVQEARHAVGQRPDLGLAVRLGHRAVAVELPARADRAGSGGSLAAGERARGRGRPATRAVSRHRSRRVPRARRHRPARRRLRQGTPPLVLRHRDRPGCVVLPVRAARACALPAGLGLRRGAVGDRARRLHAARRRPLAQRAARRRPARPPRHRLGPRARRLERPCGGGPARRR